MDKLAQSLFASDVSQVMRNSGMGHNNGCDGDLFTDESTEKACSHG